MPSVGFEHVTPEIEKLQNYTATEIGSLTHSFYFPIIQKKYILLVIGPNSAEH